jgi:paraquat-inducible protein B
MTKRISPTVIGVFVVSSFVILIAALVVLGSGKVLSKPLQFICMFQGDLNGLKVGAPVKFKGVQIGSVASIQLFLRPEQGRLRQGVTELWLPVIIDIDQQLIKRQGGTGEALQQKGFDEMLGRGVRAQLSVESILTGLLYVDLDVRPNAPLTFVLESDGPIREIPTVPTTMETVQKQATRALTEFEEIDFKRLADSITEAANSIRDLTSSSQVKATLASLQETTANLNKTVLSIRATFNNLNGQIGPLTASLQKNSVEVNSTLAQTRNALVDLRAALDPDSPLAVHLNETLDQLTETTRSLGDFTEYLQRNPSAIIRGKYIPEKDQQ